MGVKGQGSGRAETVTSGFRRLGRSLAAVASVPAAPGSTRVDQANLSGYPIGYINFAAFS